MTYALTIVVAEELALANVSAVMEALSPAKYPQVEFLLCSKHDFSNFENYASQNNVRYIAPRDGDRIPLLWRDGILAASAERVALTTAHCVPSETWVNDLLKIPLSGSETAVGGSIENRPNDNAIGRAIYLLRYVRYTPVHRSGETDDIAADNAIYRRSDILKNRDLLEIGFWEPSFHERYIEQGLSFRFDNSLRVVHHNCYSCAGFMAQRFSHGVEFGQARARQMSWLKRLAMFLAFPLIPIVFGKKILNQAKTDPQFRFGLDIQWFYFLLFLFAWSLGEALGYVKRD